MIELVGQSTSVTFEGQIITEIIEPSMLKQFEHV
jgi:hypothetical protein